MAPPFTTAAQKTADKLPAGIAFAESTVQIPDALSAHPHTVLLGPVAAPLLSHYKYLNPAFEEPLLDIIATTRTIYGSELASYLKYWLMERDVLEHIDAKTYELILNELLANAVEHGNLDLSAERSQTATDDTWLENYDNRLHQTLAGPLGEKLVVLRIGHERGELVTSVEDQGHGFTGEKNTPSPHHGMGLTLVKSLTSTLRFEAQGKRVVFHVACGSASRKKHLHTQASLKANGHILIVDDQPLNLQIAELYLHDEGFINIATTTSGYDTLTYLETHRPDLILLDVLMPNMDGFAVCKHIKTNPKTADIPVVFLTGLTDASSRTLGYQLGGVDYVHKPIDKAELIARTYVHLQNGMLLRSLQRYSDALAEDISKARRLQQSLLPSTPVINEVEKAYSLSITHEMRTCDDLAGDFWQLFAIDAEQVGFIVIDVSGHGVVAALNSVRIHAVLIELKPLLADPQQFAIALNQRLVRLFSADTFATFTYGILNTRTGVLQYVCGGAPAPLVVPHAVSDSLTILTGNALPLGITADYTPTVQTTRVEPGDTLLMYSDALSEALHADGARWLEQGVQRTLATLRMESTFTHNPARALLNAFTATAQRPLADDLTIISLTRLS